MVARSKSRGRPQFKPTSALRTKVSVLSGGGMSKEAIALALRIDTATLRKHFEFELSQGAADKRSEILVAMYKAGKEGNVAAQKAYLARNEFSDPPAAEIATPAVKEPKLGKKEIAAKDAETAGINSEWGDDLGPKPLPN